MSDIATYLTVETHKCVRCDHKWSHSYLTTSWGFPLPPSIDSAPIAYYHLINRHQLNHHYCFNCLDPSTPEKPFPKPEPKTERQWATERRLAKSSNPGPSISLDDILGD